MTQGRFGCVMSLVLSSALFCGCSAPSRAPAEVRVSAPTPVVASATAPAPAPEGEGEAEAVNKALARRAGSVGYHVEVVNSNRRYCRKVTSVNSHLPHKECLSEAQLIQQLDANDEQNNKFENMPHGPCMAKSCNGGH